MSKKPSYTAEYFIAKFEAIPEENWAIGTFYKQVDGRDCFCALGHLGYSKKQQCYSSNEETNALCGLIGQLGSPPGSW